MCDSFNIQMRTFSLFMFLLASLYFTSCSGYGTSTSRTFEREPASPRLENSFQVPGHQFVHSQLRSVQLSRTGSPTSAPVIQLGSSQTLELFFEVLSFDSNQFSVTFTHHNPDWSRSSLPVDFFMSGIHIRHLDAGRVSQNQRPSYRQYSFRFPGDGFRFTKSGNYMLHLHDQDTRSTLLSLPFFITENAGSVRSTVETFQTPRQNLRISPRPVSTYAFPELVEQPIFDLEFYYVQNQFWGRVFKADELDFSSPNEVFFGISSRFSFIGDYEFLFLSLQNLNQSNPQIFETNPGEIPPLIVLKDDVSGFSAAGRAAATGRFGRPDRRLSGQYANVQFIFEPGREVRSGEQIYLTGDFNNWTIDPDYRLSFNSAMNRWTVNSVLKEGRYYYKYVVLSGNRIDDLLFDDFFTRTQQEYHALVYKRDHREFYYRLLQVHPFTSDRN